MRILSSRKYQVLAMKGYTESRKKEEVRRRNVVSPLLEKIKLALVSPKKLFQEMKKEKGLKKAFLFSVLLSPVSLLIGLLLNVPDSFIASVIPLLSFLPFQAAIAVTFASGWLIFVLLSFFIAAIYHVFAVLLKGKGDYSASYKVAIYSSVPGYVFGWLWLPFGYLITLWSFALSVLGLKELHSLKLGKAFVVAIMPYAILFLLTLGTVLIVGRV